MTARFGDWNRLRDECSGQEIDSNALMFYPQSPQEYVDALSSLIAKDSKEQSTQLPIVVSMYLGNDCRDRCAGCFARDTYRNLPTPSRSKKSVIEEFLSLGIRDFKFGGGGDPLTASELEEALMAVHTNGGRSVVITNGDMITDDRVPLLSTAVTNFRFSGNADNKALHQIISKPSPDADDYDRRVEQVGKVVMLRRKNGLVSGTTYLANPAVPGSVEGIERYLEKAVAIGFDYFAVRYVNYFTPQMAQATASIDAKMKSLQRLLKDTISIIVPPKVTWTPQTDLMLLLKTTIDYPHHVHPCPSGGIHFNSVSYGNMDERPFMDIWRGSARQEFLARHLDLPCTPYCGKCNYGARNATYNWMADRISQGKAVFSTQWRP